MPTPDQLAAAWQRRAGLHDLDAYRLFHGWQEGAPGVEIDRYGNAAVIAYKPDAVAEVDQLAAALLELHPFEHIVAKRRGNAPVAVCGDVNAACRVRELDMRFAIDLSQRRNPGLYLDARRARAWIRVHSRDRRVLNLFAFTGSLGVAAAVGGARSVTHVDSQRGALRRCRRNHELNNVPVDDRDLVRLNIYQHLRRASARRRRFDAIIVDAPPYSEHAARADRTPGPRGIDALAPLTVPLLEPGGWVLCFFHHSQRSRADHERAFCDAAGVPLHAIWRGASDLDFPEADERNKLRLTAFERD